MLVRSSLPPLQAIMDRDKSRSGVSGGGKVCSVMGYANIRR